MTEKEKEKKKQIGIIILNASFSPLSLVFLLRVFISVFRLSTNDFLYTFAVPPPSPCYLLGSVNAFRVPSCYIVLFRLLLLLCHSKTLNPASSALLCFALLSVICFSIRRDLYRLFWNVSLFSLFISSPLCPFPIPPFVPLLSSLPPVLNYSLVSINGKHPEPNRHQRSCVTSFSSFFRVFCFLQIDVRDEILTRLCVFFHIRVKKPFKKSRRKKKFK